MTSCIGPLPTQMIKGHLVASFDDTAWAWNRKSGSGLFSDPINSLLPLKSYSDSKPGAGFLNRFIRSKKLVETGLGPPETTIFHHLLLWMYFYLNSHRRARAVLSSASSFLSMNQIFIIGHRPK